MNKEYLLGNDAIAYGLIEGGVQGVFAYPGTPSSEITEKLITLSEKYGIYVEWSINEKVAYENAYGVSLTGNRAVVIMKHVGLNVASDAFMTSAYTGVVGGLLIIVADDPYAHSSQNEQDSRRYAQFSKIPCLEPSSIQEAKDMVIFGLSFSEKIGLPVILRTVTRISHGKSDVLIGKREPITHQSSFTKNPKKFVMVPAHARVALKSLNEKQEEIKAEIENTPFNSQEIGDKTGVITAGISYLYVKETKEKYRLLFSLLKVTSYPVPEKQIYDFIKDKSSIIIFEEGDPLIEEAIYIIAQKNGLNLLIKGKLDGCLSKEGEHSLETVEKTLLPPEQQSPKTSYNITSLSLPVRAPVLCPGCPHLGSFYILKKVFGKNSIFAGDIGCYTLGIQLNAIDICLCMGAGINMGAGISKFEKERNVISIIGDSTFFHSGITGLINSCYNNSNHIISILDNRTTAMTGHQPHPGTGTTASGEKTININIEQLALISGANKVITLDPYLINESIEKLKHFKESKGVRVVIFKRECIFVARAPITKFYVDKEKCTGCKLCLQVKCPAIVFSNGKAEITNQCIGCSICAEICPFNAIQEKDNVK